MILRTFRACFPGRVFLPLKVRLGVVVLSVLAAVFIAHMVDRDFPPPAFIAAMVAGSALIYSFVTHTLYVWVALVVRP